mmetsp:Transcript_21864/g.50436  ORF Transcript_21864/g.50436 Transcript_21864/m.50436 type:complete len:106 (-) Transcript_21864:485-802(-)
MHHVGEGVEAKCNDAGDDDEVEEEDGRDVKDREGEEVHRRQQEHHMAVVVAAVVVVALVAVVVAAAVVCVDEHEHRDVRVVPKSLRFWARSLSRLVLFRRKYWVG